MAHHARDSCCQAVYHGQAVAETLTRVAAWAPRARAARAGDLAAYLERLGGYAARGAVDREGALRRLLDLGRCHEPTRAQVDLRPVEGGWQGTLVHSGGNRRIRVDAATGALTRVGDGARARRR